MRETHESMKKPIMNGKFETIFKSLVHLIVFCFLMTPQGKKILTVNLSQRANPPLSIETKANNDEKLEGS